MKTSSERKKTERGYIVVFGTFGILVLTIIFACCYMSRVTQMNYEIARMNVELSQTGMYIQIPQVIADMTPFNWIISAESAAFSIVAAAQFKKKATNNNFEYAEQLLDKWASANPEDVKGLPYVVQIVQTWISSNSNN